MKSFFKHKKLLIIIPTILILIFAFIIIFVPEILLKVVDVYDDFYKWRYRMDFPNNKETLYLQDTLSDMTLIDQTYDKTIGAWHLYIQADTSEKAELIIEKFPEMMDYGNLNLKNFSALTVNCQIDRLSDHFASCPPYVYKFEAEKDGENEIKLFIDTTYISDQEKICEILGNGRFNSVTLLDSDFELNIDIPYSFPNLKKYVVDHQELWTYSDQDQNVNDECNTET